MKGKWNRRGRDGRYEESEPCESCGKPAGDNYWSLSMASTEGIGLILCHRVRCPANKPGLDEDDIKHLITSRP